MRYLYVLLAATLPFLLNTNANAQVIFDNLNYDEQFDFDTGYEQFGPLFNEVDETLSGFRLRGDSFIRRNPFFQPQLPFDDSVLSGQVIRFVATRDFQVGPLPVNVDFSMDEDVKWILSNGQDANPQIEISSRAYILSNFFGDASLVEPLLLESATPDESRLNGVGIHAENGEQIVEDYILGPSINGFYTMVYETSIFLRHDTLLNDPTAILTMQGGAFSGHGGIDVNLTSSVIAPEPSSFVMASMGISSLAWVGWRRKRRSFSSAL